MAFCQTCGSEVEGRFCAKCGAAMGAPAAGTTGSGASAGPTAQAGGMTDNVASALCYALGLITGIVFLALAPYNQNKLIRFHAFQSIFMHVAVLILFIGVFPVIGMMLGSFFYFLSPLFGLGSLLLWAFMMWKAYSNEKVKLPVIGDLAEKQA